MRNPEIIRGKDPSTQDDKWSDCGQDSQHTQAVGLWSSDLRRGCSQPTKRLRSPGQPDTFKTSAVSLTGGVIKIF